MHIEYDEETQTVHITISSVDGTPTAEVFHRVAGGSVSLPTLFCDIGLHDDFTACKGLIRSMRRGGGMYVPIKGRLRDCFLWMLRNPQTIKGTILAYNNIGGQRMRYIDEVFAEALKRFEIATCTQTLGEFMKEHTNAA